MIHECDEEEEEASEKLKYGVELRNTQGSKGFYRNKKTEVNEISSRGRGRGRFARGRGSEIWAGENKQGGESNKASWRTDEVKTLELNNIKY